MFNIFLTAIIGFLMSVYAGVVVSRFLQFAEAKRQAHRLLFGAKDANMNRNDPKESLKIIEDRMNETYSIEYIMLREAGQNDAADQIRAIINKGLKIRDADEQKGWLIGCLEEIGKVRPNYWHILRPFPFCGDCNCGRKRHR